jgi:hypothetical protein
MSSSSFSYFYHSKRYVLNFTKKYFFYVLGDFLQKNLVTLAATNVAMYIAHRNKFRRSVFLVAVKMHNGAVIQKPFRDNFASSHLY